MTAPIPEPSSFKGAFESLNESLCNLLDAIGLRSQEHELLCFELVARHERPVELLQTLLDLLRVLYEPHPPGSMLLNSNWDLVSQAVPVKPFRLGYMSVTGTPGQQIQDLLDAAALPRLQALGYAGGRLASFVCVAAGARQWERRIDILQRVNRTFAAGFTTAMAMEAIEDAASGIGTWRLPEGMSLAGVSQDPSLDRDQLRISTLIYLQNPDPESAIPGVPH